MQRDKVNKLHNEIDKGKRAERAMKEFIRPFLDEKRKVIYEGFLAVSVEDTTRLMECKRQSMALDALETDIQSIIDTGKMASKSIADIKKETENE